MILGQTLLMFFSLNITKTGKITKKGIYLTTFSEGTLYETVIQF